jgi:acetyl esterase/lipase
MRTHRPVALVLALTAAALVPRSGRAAADCVLDNAPTKITYWHTSSPSAGDWRCDWNPAGPSCHLAGWLIEPKAAKDPAAGDLPAVMFLHGSGTRHGTSYVCEMSNYLTRRGYVVFMPIMRGVDDTSPAAYTGHGFHNTGIYVSDWAAARVNASYPASYWTLVYMRDHEMNDVHAALTTLASQRSGDGTRPLVDPYRIAVMGHSYGGALAVLASAAGLSPRPGAVIDLSGAAMSWSPGGGGWWGYFLGNAVLAREMPMYFQMSAQENPHELLDPVVDLFTDANTVVNSFAGDAMMAIYSQFAIPLEARMACNTAGTPDYQCAHNYFVMSHDQVWRWMPHAVAFLTRLGF